MTGLTITTTGAYLWTDAAGTVWALPSLDSPTQIAQQARDWIAQGNTPTQEGPPLATPEIIAAAKSRVAAFADQMAAAVTGPVPETERASWGTKEITARAYLAGTASPSQIAMLQAECDLTGETLQHLAEAIVTNAESYVAISGAIAGQRRVTMAALDALVIGTATAADVDTVLDTAKAQAEAMLAQILA